VDRRWVNLLTQQIQAAEVRWWRSWRPAPATVEQLLSFKPGDFIELDLRAVIQAKVDGVPVFDCHYGTSSAATRSRSKIVTGLRSGWMGEHHGS
jgi:flagellar motor switch protein FliM